MVLVGIVVCRVGIPENDEYTRLTCALLELKGRSLTQVKRPKRCSMLSIKMRSAKKAISLASARKMVGCSMESGSPPFPASEETAVKEDKAREENCEKKSITVCRGRR